MNQNIISSKVTLADFEQRKRENWNNLYPNGKQLINRIIDLLAKRIKDAERKIKYFQESKKADEAYRAAQAAAEPATQTNYRIILENPIHVSILIGILNKTGMMHIRKSYENYSVLSTGPWGNNIKPQSTKGDGYIDRLDLLKLPIKPNQVVTVNRKMLEAGMDEYGSGYRLTFTDKKTKKVLIEIDLGSPVSVTEVDVDRPNSEINDIGRNITYSATVTETN